MINHNAEREGYQKELKKYAINPIARNLALWWFTFEGSNLCGFCG